MWNLTIWKIPQSSWECNLQSQYDCKGWPSFGNYPYGKYHNLIENVLYNLNMIAKVDHYVIMENTTISLRMHFTISIQLQRLTNNLKMCQLGKPSIKKMVKLGKKSKLNIQSKLSKFGKKLLKFGLFPMFHHLLKASIIYVIMENTTILLGMQFTISIWLQRLTNNLKMCQLWKPS